MWNKEQVASNWPKRAVITTGTPYGNKPLHFGHIGGVFVPADAFARFLRDRIGKENVRFVGGTDCYGSPINEGYRKAIETSQFTGSISDYVQKNHDLQKSTLSAYDISLDIFEGSAIGKSALVHSELTKDFVRSLYEAGKLQLKETSQFYDEKAQTYLNGRQVVGHCPVAGCKSKVAYADECELGHQFAPEDLINPISTITREVPVMKPVKNWYFDLPSYSEFLKNYCEGLKEDKNIRDVVSQTIMEFLGAPVVYIKKELFDDYVKIKDELPAHIYRAPEGEKQSFEIEFDNVEMRDKAKIILHQSSIRFRTGKALVPFRITGNIEWGVLAPEIEGVKGLTVWCWPESLWQPISFTIALCESLGESRDSWKDFWCDEECVVYQFLGQDNLYFYGVAQSALFDAVKCTLRSCDNKCALRQTRLIANHHLLFGKTKASSSGDIKPPSGEELLEHYTAEQLRCHFLALALGQKAVPFSPKPFDPTLSDEAKRDPRVADPVLKEAALLNNIFNRLARSCFYEAKNTFNSNIEMCDISAGVIEAAHKSIYTYDKFMQSVELHKVVGICDEFIRYAQKYWADGAKQLSENNAEKHLRAQHLCDCIYLTWISALMMHPIAPRGCELICEMMRCNKDGFFSWNKDFISLKEIFGECDFFEVEELPARFDFFPKHPSQFKK